jgi:hypothetical protein
LGGTLQGLQSQARLNAAPFLSQAIDPFLIFFEVVNPSCERAVSGLTKQGLIGSMG